MENTIISDDSILHVNQKVTIRDDDHVLYHRDDGTLTKLNNTGYLLIKLLNGKRTVREIAEAVALEMDVKVDLVVSNLLEFYLSLFENKLIGSDNNTLR